MWTNILAGLITGLVMFSAIALLVWCAACVVCFYVLEVAWAWEIFRQWMP